MKVPINDIKTKSLESYKDVDYFIKLVRHIQDHGVYLPVKINENYEVVSGVMRVEACRILGHKEVECEMINS